MVAEAVANGALHATSCCRDAVDAADISLVCVGTPSEQRSGTDLTYIRRALADIVAGLRSSRRPASGHHSVVVRSTVPPGTVQDIVAGTLAAELADADLDVGAAMCPEFLREGSGIADFFDPPLVVVGTADPKVASAVSELFGFLERPVQVVDTPTAEALKYACNAFHATKVSFANELARLLRVLGIDSRAVMELFCQDTVLNISPAEGPAVAAVDGPRQRRRPAAAGGEPDD